METVVRWSSCNVLDCQSIGFYGTATQYRLYSAGECVVNVRVSVCAEYSGVVPPAPSSSG